MAVLCLSKSSWELMRYSAAGAERAVELARLAARAEADLAALGGALDVEPGPGALKRAKAAAWAEQNVDQLPLEQQDLSGGL